MSKKILAQATEQELESIRERARACQQVSQGVASTLNELVRDIAALQLKLDAITDSQAQ